MPIVTKATAIQFIDSKCHIKKRKSRKIALSGYYACVSRDLLLVPSVADTHTHTQTYQCSWMKRFQEARHVQATGPHLPGLRNEVGITIKSKETSS